MPRIFARAYICGPELHPDEVKGRSLSANKGFVVQASRAEAAQNELFVELLAAQTLRAQELGSLLAKKPEIDLLLRLAGTTQISEAIKRTGARRGRQFLVVVAGNSRVRDAKGMAPPRLPRRELTRDELSRVEKAALLSTKRA